MAPEDEIQDYDNGPSTSHTPRRPRLGPHSQKSRMPSYVRFVNRTVRQVDIVWLNYEGLGVKFKSLSPQQHIDVNTYVGHPWIFRDSITGDKLVVEFHEVYQPRGYTGALRRRIVNITVPVYSLRERCLQVVRRLVPREDIPSLEIPPMLHQELLNPDHRVSMTEPPVRPQYRRVNVQEQANMLQMHAQRLYNHANNYLNMVGANPDGEGGAAAAPPPPAPPEQDQDPEQMRRDAQAMNEHAQQLLHHAEQQVQMVQALVVSHQQPYAAEEQQIDQDSDDDDGESTSGTDSEDEDNGEGSSDSHSDGTDTQPDEEMTEDHRPKPGSSHVKSTQSFQEDTKEKENTGAASPQQDSEDISDGTKTDSSSSSSVKPNKSAMECNVTDCDNPGDQASEDTGAALTFIDSMDSSAADTAKINGQHCNKEDDADDNHKPKQDMNSQSEQQDEHVQQQPQIEAAAEPVKPGPSSESQAKPEQNEPENNDSDDMEDPKKLEKHASHIVECRTFVEDWYSFAQDELDAVRGLVNALGKHAQQQIRLAEQKLKMGEHSGGATGTAKDLTNPRPSTTSDESTESPGDGAHEPASDRSCPDATDQEQGRHQELPSQTDKKGDSAKQKDSDEIPEENDPDCTTNS